MGELMKVADTVLYSVGQHAIGTYPKECCGFLYGYERPDHLEVRVSRPARNGHIGLPTRRYRITREEYLEGEEFAHESGLNLLGVYHSHPDHPAAPSQYDEEWAVPGLVYLIVSIDQLTVSDFRWWQLSHDSAKLMELKFLKNRLEEDHT